MTEDQVNQRCKSWLISQGYKYKGILNLGLGQVPVPDGNRQVLLDHQGFNDHTKELVWIEAKGSGVNFSELLEGFIRTCYGIYHGGGNGYLAVPHDEYGKMLEQKEFLKAVAESVNGKGLMGLFDAEDYIRLLL
jgi:hypothetical protein